VSNDFGDAGQFADGGGVARGVAAHDYDGGIGVRLVETPDSLAALGVALGGDGAGVDDAQVRRPAGLRLDVAVEFQHFLDVLRLVLVDLATEGEQTAGGGGVHGSPGCNRQTVSYHL